MITDQDITKLKEVFATKEDLNAQGQRFDKNLERLEVKMDQMEDRLSRSFNNAILSLQDNLLKVIQGQQHEHAAENIKWHRHDAWIKQIAEETNVTLKD